MMSHNDSHSHGGSDHDGEHAHHHPSGFKGVLYQIFVPHSHDPADAIDDALEANTQGIRALKISLIVLLITTVLQAIIVSFTGSVALLADTIHNFADALTAVPLWIAFILSRRAATRRYTYGYNRAEDLAGLFIVLVIAVSAILAAWQSIDRIIDPRPLHNIGWVIAAGIIGFLGNEAVAIYRIGVGQKIGSAALVADGIHARIDGVTSLAVVLGGAGVLLGMPLADPIVGLIISAMILVLLVGTIGSIGRRLMDGIEPEILDRAEHALHQIPEIHAIEQIRLRWIGHRLHGDATIHIADVSLTDANTIAGHAEQAVKQDIPNLDDISIRTIASQPDP